MRSDGYVKVVDLLKTDKLKDEDLNLAKLKELVATNAKQRYNLMSELTYDGEEEWWIRANQGHSLKNIQLDMKPITALSDIPTGIAVHGTMLAAWNSIRSEGLSKMNRNHIHLAQGISGDNVISGMRKSCQVFIFIDVQKAIDAGLKFFLSDNGVVLTEGDERGLLKSEFFLRVEDSKRVELTDWRQ